MPRTSWAIASVLLAACQSSSFTESTTSEPLTGHGVHDDPDTPEANVVVRLTTNTGMSCSGTLITPQIVLTANHCIGGYAPTDECTPVATNITVHVGPSIVGGSPTFTAAAILQRNVGCQPDKGSDLALIYLTEPVTPATLKQWTVAPAVTPQAPRIYPPTFLSPGGALFGVAGYQGTSQRSSKSFLSAGLEYVDEHSSGSNFYWEIEMTDWNTDDGDSGGPLYAINGSPPGDPNHDDNLRHVIGVHFGKSGDNMVWADITRPGNNSFMTHNLQEGNVPPDLRHSAAWLAAHGKTTSSWWGQTDYTGVCDPNGRDWDCDGWFDHGPVIHDNCPAKPNSVQRDTDDDGVGDLCDPCPDESSDPDDDGICTGGPNTPPGYVPDNCPRVFNRDQANCNLASERANGLEVLGDVCDPVPCPLTTTVSTSYAKQTGNGQPQLGGIHTGRLITDKFAVKRIPPHRRDANTPTPVPLGIVTTGARFCQKNLAAGYDCRAAQSLRDDHFFALEALSPARPWHRVSTAASGYVRGASWLWSYNGATGTDTWDFRADASYWKANNLIPPPEPTYQPVCNDIAMVGAGTCLGGTMWYHAETQVGDTVSVVNATFVGLHGDNLANSYVDVVPDFAIIGSYSRLGMMKKQYLKIPEGGKSPHEYVMKARVRPLVAVDYENPLHVLEDHGGSVLATGVSEQLAQYMTYALDWVSAAEPPGVASKLDPAIIGIAVGFTGVSVVDGVHAQDGRIQLLYEAGNQGFNSGWDPRTPRDRLGWVGTFSRSAGGFFLLGGDDYETAEPLHDVQFWRYGHGWEQLPVTVTRPRAAVYSPNDQRLWILDETTSALSGLPQMTLLRVDPWSGTSEVAGSWPRGTTWDRHYLSLDRDGGVLLTATSSAQAQTKVGKLALRSGAAYAAVLDATVPFTTSEPLVDQSEYGFILRDADDGMTGVTRRANLTGGSAELGVMFQ